MSVVLTGFRGSGKTTVGRLLAGLLHLHFVDCDEQIVARTGKSIREIFSESGEAAFRELESTVLAELSSAEDRVIAVGGGAVIREENRRVLAKGRHQIVYLRCEAEELQRRIAGDPATAETRPNLTQLGGGIEEIRSVLATREPIYQATMTAQLDVTQLSPEQAARQVMRLLAELTAGDRRKPPRSVS